MTLRLLVVGRLEHQKGVDILLGALAKALRQRPGGFQLDVLGDGTQRRELEVMTSSLGLEGNVQFLGALPRDETSRYYEKADVVVIAARFDASSLVLFEAWGAGKAVVATAVGSVPDVATDMVNALITQVGDEAGLAAALVSLHDRPDLRSSLGSAGRDRLSALPSWMDVSHMYLEVYSQLLREPR